MLHFAALAEERIGFVEEQNGMSFFRFPEHCVEILFTLADPRRNHTREIYLQKWKTDNSGDDLGSERLARPRLTCEKDLDAATLGQPAKAPLFVNQRTGPEEMRDLKNLFVD